MKSFSKHSGPTSAQTPMATSSSSNSFSSTANGANDVAASCLEDEEADTELGRIARGPRFRHQEDVRIRLGDYRAKFGDSSK
eukprot:8280535-Alexandrium_andersonii.AAC.1